MIPNVQILRGIAATIVAASHLPAATAHFGLADVLPNVGWGFFGVDLFFVISGFIMFYVAGFDTGPRSAFRFLWRRAARVVPLYWLFTSLILLLNLHERRHAATDPFQIWHTVASYLFIPFPEAPDRMDIYPIYAVGWTLNYEILFYVCFACAMLFAPRFRLILVSGCLIGLVVLGQAVSLPVPFSFWARSNLLEFVFGMLIAAAVLRGVKIAPGPGLALVAAAIVGVALFLPFSEDWDVVRGLGWGMPAAAMVAAAALVRPNKGGLLSRALEGIGDASYSLYLLHPAFYDGVLLLFRNAVLSHTVRLRFLLPAMLIGSLGAAFLVYRLVERPMTRALQRSLVGRTPRVQELPPGLST